jgi:hypothetical protein
MRAVICRAWGRGWLGAFRHQLPSEAFAQREVCQRALAEARFTCLKQVA